MEFQGKTLQAVQFRPIVLNAIGRDAPPSAGEDAHTSVRTTTQGLPVPAAGEKARVILNRLAELSWPFGTWVEVTGDTAHVRLNKK